MFFSKMKATSGSSAKLSFNWFAALLFLLFQFKTTAQTIENQRLTSDSVVLKEITIRATTVGERSPVPHSNVSKEEILERNQGQDLPFLLRQTPSLVETSDAGTGVGYTGLRIRGSDPTRINVTLNGIPLNDAESQQVYWVDLPDFAASTDEIQVQRGVGSSTNGAGAFGATVNLTTTRQSVEPYARLSQSAGSFGTLKSSVNVGTGRFQNGFSFDGRLSKIKSDGFVDRASSDLDSWFLSGAWVGERGSVRANLFSGHEKTYQSWYGLPAQYIDNEALRTYNVAGTERPISPYENQVDDYGQRHFQLLWNQKLTERLRFNLHLHDTRGKGFYEEYKAKQTLTDYNLPLLVTTDTTISTADLVRRKWLDNDFYGATWAVFYEKNRLNSTIGGAWNEYDGLHFGEVAWAEIYAAPTGQRFYQDTATKRDFNLFWKTERSFSAFGRSVLTMIDLQYRRVNYSFLGFNEARNQANQSVKLDFFNPKTGFSIEISSKQRAYAFVGVGHHEPNRDDFTASSPASRPKPERLIDYEIGYVLNEKGAIGASANLFFMDYFDQLALTGRINDVGAATRVNVPRSHRAGVEIEAHAHFLKRGRLVGNASFSENKICRFDEFVDVWDDGSQLKIEHRNSDLSFSPPVVAGAELSWELLKNAEKQSFSMVFAGKYVGRQFLDNTSSAERQLDSYSYFDGRLRFYSKKLRGCEVSVLLSVNNIFNQKYSSNGWTYHFQSAGYDPTPDDPYARKEGANGYNLTGFFPQAGRHFLATVNLGF